MLERKERRNKFFDLYGEDENKENKKVCKVLIKMCKVFNSDGKFYVY